MSAIGSPAWQSAMWKQPTRKSSPSFRQIPIAKPTDVAPGKVVKIDKPGEEDRPARKGATKLEKMLRQGKSKKKSKKKP